MATGFTIADVLMWARTKPADEVYNYWCNRCAIGQFLVDTGRARDPLMGELWWSEGWGGDRHEIDRALNEAAYTPMGGPGRTFGYLVKRLEKLIPAEPISDTWTKADAYLTDIDAVSA
jgi:hypothetical protein